MIAFALNRKLARVFDPDLQSRFFRSATNAMFECIEASLAVTKIWQEQVLTAATTATIPLSPVQPPAPIAPPVNPIAAIAALQVAAITKPLQAWEWAFDAVGGKQHEAAAKTSFEAVAPKQDTSWMPSVALMFPWLAMKPEPKAPPAASAFTMYQPLMQSMFAPWLALANASATGSAFTPNSNAAAFSASAFPSQFFGGQAFGGKVFGNHGFNGMASNPFAAAFQFPSKAFDASHWNTTMTDMMKIYWSMPAMPWTLYQAPMTAMFVSAGMPYAIAAPAARASAAAMDAADAARLQTIQAFDAYSSYRSDGGHASAQVIMWPFADPNAKRRAT